MNIRRFVTIFLFCIAMVAIAIESIFPAPKVSQFCNQPGCFDAARDILIGKNEDYLGQLIPVFLLALGLGFIITIFSLLKKNPQHLAVAGLSMILATIVYGILLRFYVIFSLWPIAAWFLALTVLVGSTVFMVTRTADKKNKQGI